MISIHPYLRNSKSVQTLLERGKERGVPIKVRTESNPKRGILVHWGKRKHPKFQDYQRRVPIVNHRQTLEVMMDKLDFFKHVGKDSGLVPEWTDSSDVAREWGGNVVARFKTAGSGGEGLSLWKVDGAGDDGEFPDGAPLYTRYVKKQDEYRCHVFRDKQGGFSIRLSQRKAAKRNEDGALEVKNWQVRNLENGFVFAKNDGHVLPNAVSKCCVDLMSNHFSGLDFVALDVVYNAHSDKAYVLEGNTAPGLDGTTTDIYLDYFIERLDA